jgi:ribonuclease Z
VRTPAWVTILTILSLILMTNAASAQQPPQLDPEVLKQLEASGYETNPEVFKAVATGGQPLGRWKEGLLFDGIEPMPWLASAANWFPGKTDVPI